MTMARPHVINMWSGPRNISTAFMYSWRQRADTRVFDEPFYGVYLEQFDPGHPGRQEIIASMELDVTTILEEIVAPGAEPVRYIKNIGHHLDGLDETILDEFPNALLIRHPRGVIASLSDTLGDEFSVDITGLAQQVRILDHELGAGRTPVVIDSQWLLGDPAGRLPVVCERLGVDPDPAMLSWPAGPKPEDGLWAQYWYHNARASTGFGAPRTHDGPLTERQQDLLAACLPLYERLAPHAIAT